MKKSIFIFVMTTLLSVGVIIYGCMFIDSQIGEATLIEKTVTGDLKETEGLTVGFRVDAGEDLHWINSYDYSSGKIESVFKRGEMLEAVETSIYDDIQRDKTFAKGDLTKTVKTSLYEDIRFTGWSIEPFTTMLDYDGLKGLQEKKIHTFYDEIQQSVMKSGKEKEGKIQLKDYLDYYPISFHLQLGTNRYDSSDALTGLKIYEEQGLLSPENGAAYDKDVVLYTAFNTMFRIPVIDNEYQEYKVSKIEEYDPETSLGYTAEVKKSSDHGEDYYEFDPIMVIQEDDKKNRILFIVNNRTAKGEIVDVSQISGGYGVYELPIEVGSRAIEMGNRVVAVPDPIPLPDQMEMIYPLDEKVEYVEISLSSDHKYLAIFFIEDERYNVEFIDTDRWTSCGQFEMFPASEKITYAWGDDGSIAVTNHKDYIAVFARPENKDEYEAIYMDKVDRDIDSAFFDDKMVDKKNSYAKYRYGVDEGLAVAVKDGKAVLVQNLLISNSQFNSRNAELECLVVDANGVVYRGRLRSNIVDYEYDVNKETLDEINSILDEGVGKKLKSKSIVPVGNEKWIEWISDFI